MFEKIGIAFVVLVIGLALGYFLTRRYFPKVNTVAKIEYRDRLITERDTVYTEPTTVIKYRQVPYEVTVRDTVYLPPLQNFNVAGVVSNDMTRIQADKVTVTYFSLSDSAYVQNVYRLSRPSFGYSLSAFTEIGAVNTAVLHSYGLTAAMRYKRATLYLSAATGASGASYAVVGLRYRFAGVD